jgi:hypothetical protein
MKLDRSHIGITWRVALSRIFYATRKTLKPVIIVRGDDPLKLHKMQRYFLSRSIVIIRLGVACSVIDMYSEILLQMSKDKFRHKRDDINGIVHNIVLKAKSGRSNYSIIIDNCHYILPSQLFRLLGLANELEGKARFFLFFTERNFEKWHKGKNSKDNRFKYFLNCVGHKYEVSL